MNVAYWLYPIVGAFTVLFLILLVYYYVWPKRQVKEPAFPPNQFMREVGIQCPDYWIYDSTRNVCVNKFNIPLRDPQTCYDDEKARTKSFKKITRWPVHSNSLDEVLRGRCDWIRRCGPQKNINASWVGIDGLC